MRKKSASRSRMELFAVIAVVLVFSEGTMGLGTQTSTTASTTVTAAQDLETCQCGVFLLGTQPLVFSADAKPILSGMPVPANCSARDDKLQCASICRQLIETMSQSNEDSPLVQTVVLAATRTLACQRFNESERVPLPRNIDASSHQAKLDGQTNKWKFMVGPLGRSELGAENDHNADGDIEDEETNSIGKLTEPKYLGGFYRWCDEHWIYAGVSLHEPLCCLQHLPKKCPTSKAATSRNGRRPRLIIRRCKNDDCSSEEDFPTVGEEPSNTITKTPSSTAQTVVNSEETETPDPDANDETNATSSEKIDPFTTPVPAKNRKPLNSTALAEAFEFITSLMDSVGWGGFVQGITSVLPSSTAVELIDRMDVGGWIGNYQDRYMTWPREFGMGYCYMEYSLYNAAQGDIVATTNNFLSRVFKNQNQRTGPGGLPPTNNMIMPPHHQPQAQPPPHFGDIMPASPPPVFSNNPNNPNNYISPMAPLPENSFNYNNYGQSNLVGNRRVKRTIESGIKGTPNRIKRTPGVTVSRSYSSATGSDTESSRPTLRRAVRRKIATVPRARNAPSSIPSVPVQSEPVPMTSGTVESVPVPVIPAPEPQTVFFNNSSPSVTSFAPSSSFIPTNSNPPQYNQNPSRFTSEHHHQPVPLINPHYNQNQYYHYEVPQQQYYPQGQNNVQRSHQQSQNPSQSLTDFARPRRNPSGPGNSQYGNQHLQPQQRVRQPPPPQKEVSKEGPSGGGSNLMDIASLLVKTAMSGNNNNNGDQVSSIMQNALPLVSQVASSPAIQGMVSSIVTSFLTPPQKSPPTPPPTQKPQPVPEDIDGNNLQEDSQEYPQADVEASDEIQTPDPTPAPTRPPSSSGGGDGGIIPNMLFQLISTYMGYMTGSGSNSKPSQTGPPRIDPPSNRPGPSKEKKDIVDMICENAKPFFMSYFGVVPGDPGYGKLGRMSRRKDKPSTFGGKDGLLEYDPDPGTKISDILLGSPNIPETGNSLFDFGNRVVYAFHSANDPQHGMYCLKQYSVNKIWDYFRVGVKAVFKK